MNAPAILLRRYNELPVVEQKFGMRGIITAEVLRGGKVVRSRKFNNLITTVGLNRYGSINSRSLVGTCRVGTGTATPAFTDTDLGVQVATTSYSPGTNTCARDGTDWYAETTAVFTFAVGAINANLTEVGIGGSTAGTLFSRALFVNGSNVPTAFPVASDEQLRVTYALRIYGPPADITGSISISGVTYGYTMRAAAANNQNYWSAFNLGGDSIMSEFVGGYPCGFSSTMGIITELPTGSPYDASVSNAAYVNSSYQREGTYTYSPSSFNGVLRTQCYKTRMGVVQCQFDSNITKSNLFTLILPARIAWARR